jgi:hypothetical protein
MDDLTARHSAGLKVLHWALRSDLHSADLKALPVALQMGPPMARPLDSWREHHWDNLTARHSAGLKVLHWALRSDLHSADLKALPVALQMGPPMANQTDSWREHHWDNLTARHSAGLKVLHWAHRSDLHSAGLKAPPTALQMGPPMARPLDTWREHHWDRQTARHSAGLTAHHSAGLKAHHSVRR